MKPDESAATLIAIERADAAPGYNAVTVRFDDDRTEQAFVDARHTPADIAPGDRVLVVRAALYRRWALRRPS